jgi:hypothetical protein
MNKRSSLFWLRIRDSEKRFMPLTPGEMAGPVLEGDAAFLVSESSHLKVQLSICHFVNLSFCQLDILSDSHFVNLSFCQLVILST